jgi:CDGSH-type Zn-finger protein
MTTTIKVLPNGPYKVSGTFELINTDGQTITLLGGTETFLCRCGGSAKKPFCDGTHNRIGFKAAESTMTEREKHPEDPFKKSPS